MALKASFSSFSSSSSSSFSYDVFLSFRGTDTRFGFTGNLYKALCEKGIHTFIDDEELQRGEEITPSLVKAIQESRIAILVLSTNYASSTFCLDELVKIIECIKKEDRLVLPVFYDVNPSHIRHQKGSFGEAMAKHEERFKDDMDRVQKWRMALQQVANLCGYHFTHGDGYEHKFIGKIVEDVSRKIGSIVLSVDDDHLVGVAPKVLKVTSLLDVGSNDGVHVVGIYGISGIGKTTLAQAVYDHIACHFEGTCFLENVREKANKCGLEHLQSILLFNLLGDKKKKKIKLTSVQHGISTIKRRLHQKKVLLILDDVDEDEQLQAIVGKPEWFGPGSRVIITTRDKQLLARNQVEKTYEVEGLNETEAHKLLRSKAFKSVNVNPGYANVLKCAVTYACGLPLALEVMGSSLFGKSVEEWESALAQYEKIPINKIHERLKVSFDALGDVEQNVFLDIACCFKGYQWEEVEDMLHAHYGSCMKYHIGVLEQKCLIKINWFGNVTLHDLIEDMAKEIVRQESKRVPGKRSRLWFHKDIVQVLKNNQGTDKIEMIHLEFPLSKKEAKIEWDGKAFKRMKNLKTLIIRNAHFSKGPKYLPNVLRVLEWWGYPSQYLPSNFHPKKLSIFKLHKSCCMLRELAGLLKKLVNLKVLNFDFNKCLIQIPDVSGLPNLEKLSFKRCDNLIRVHDSVGFLDKLKFLSAHGCKKLRSFPPIKLPSLEELNLADCPSLESFPEILGKMENITHLMLWWTGIKDLPFSFRNLSRLRYLSLVYSEIDRIPSVIVMMPELAEIVIHPRDKTRLSPKQDEVEETLSSRGSSDVKYLCLIRCDLKDDFFPLGLAWFANVHKLDLSVNNFTILPECIKECRFLRELRVDECQNLREIRGIPPNLERFSAVNCGCWTSLCSSMLLDQELHEAGNTMFILPITRIPEWFEHQTRGPSISFWFRNKFPGIALCLVTARGNHDCGDIEVMVVINGNKNSDYNIYSWPGKRYMDHMLLFDLEAIIVVDNRDEALSENEWNHAEVSYRVRYNYQNVTFEHVAKESGIHVFKQKSNVEDIRFTDPHKRRKLDDGLCSP